MPSGRRSNRLASKPAEGELPVKRRPKPNSNTLASFTANQPPLSKGTTRKRPSKRTIETPRASPEKDTPETPTQTSPATAFSTPLPKRIKTSAAPPPPFDPQAKRIEYPHKVALTITPSINGQALAAILKTIDINDPIFCENFELLQDHTSTKRIKPWEENRVLKPHEKCQLQHWTVTIGNTKGHHSTIQVEDEQEWDDCLAQLRQMEFSGDRKNCYKLTIEAIYRSHGRQATPPVVDSNSKPNKSLKSTVRNTPLIDPTLIEISSDIDNANGDPEEEYELDSDSLPMVQKKKKRPRDSATSRQLAELRATQIEEQRTDSLPILR